MSHPIHRKALLFTAIALLCTLTAGCKTDDPTTKNTMGTFSTLVDAQPPQIVDAVKDEFEAMALKAIEATSTDLDGKVTASTAQDRKIKVTVNREGDTSSRVKVHVSPFGDTEISMTIIERLRKRLAGDK